MSFPDTVFATLMGPDAWARHQACEKAFAEEVERHTAMPDAALAECAEYCLRNCERPQWSRGEPVYDGVMYHVILPELIRRLRD